jgi:hypothetical protein
MKKLLLLLLLIPNLVMADEWKDVDGQGRFFWKIWDLVNKKPRMEIYFNDDSGVSAFRYVEINCKEKKVRYLRQINYSRWNLEGGIAFTDSKADDRYFYLPTASEGRIFGLACAGL